MQNETTAAASITDFLDLLKSRGKLLVLCFFGAMVPAVLFNQTAPTTFRASAKVIFEQNENALAKNPFASFAEDDFIANQVERMQTRQFAKDIYAALEDSTRKQFPQFKINDADVTDLGQISNIRDGIRYLKEKMKAAKRWMKGGDDSRTPTMEEKLVIYIQENLRVSPIRKTKVIKIAFESESAGFSRILANAAAGVLIHVNLGMRKERYGSLKTFIDGQIGIVQQRLKKSGNALRSYKEKNKIASIEDESSALIQRFTQAEIAFNEVRSDREQQREKLNSINRKLKAERADLEANVIVTTSPLVARLKQRLVDAEVLHSNLLLQNLPPDNPKMLEIQGGIVKLKGQLVEAAMEFNRNGDAEKILDPLSQIEKFTAEAVALEVEVQALRAKEANLRTLLTSYRRTMQRIPEAEMTLYRLTREKDVNHKLYMNLLEEKERARIKEASQLGNIRIIDLARRPESPISPNKMLNFMLAGLMSVVLWIGLILVTEVLRSARVVTARDLEEMLDAPVLAALPEIKKDFEKHSKAASPYISTYKNGDSMERIMLASEVQKLYYNLRQELEWPATIVITSSTPNEGKSSIARMLATTCAQLGEKTLLIDADMRRPTQHLHFNLHKAPGLTEFFANINVSASKVLPGAGDLKARVLSGASVLGMTPAEKERLNTYRISRQFVQRELAKVTAETKVDNLKVIPAGRSTVNPLRIWSSKSWARIFGYFKLIADVVILDTPPLIGLLDTAFISSHADAVLFCNASGKIDKKTLNYTLQTFKSTIKKSEKRLFASVLNRVDKRQFQNYYSYYNAKEYS